MSLGDAELATRFNTQESNTGANLMASTGNRIRRNMLDKIARKQNFEEGMTRDAWRAHLASISADRAHSMRMDADLHRHTLREAGADAALARRKDALEHSTALSHAYRLEMMDEHERRAAAHKERETKAARMADLEKERTPFRLTPAPEAPGTATTRSPGHLPDPMGVATLGEVEAAKASLKAKSPEKKAESAARAKKASSKRSEQVVKNNAAKAAIQPPEIDESSL